MSIKPLHFILLFTACVSAGASSPASGASNSNNTKPDPYNCSVLEEKNGRLEEKQLGTMECILHKLDRIERKLGCPLEDYLEGTCPYSPADTSATFCISQGREGGIGAEFGAEAHAEWEGGAGWPQVAWAKLAGKVEHPVFLAAGPVPVPIPTALKVTGAASLGRNFDICIEVPIVPSNQTGPLELYSDEALIDMVVRTINEPQTFEKSKFQRRLGRLANYAILRVPGTDRFGLFELNADQGQAAKALDDDGETEFDIVEDAMARFMAGELELDADGGPMAMLKSPVVQDLATVLEVPEPVQQVLNDPDMVIGRLFEMGDLVAGFGTPTGAATLGTATSVCSSFGLNSELQDRFPAVESFCGLFSVLPGFSQTTGVFSLISTVHIIVAALPDLEEIKAAACEIAGWNCPE